MVSYRADEPSVPFTVPARLVIAQYHFAPEFQGSVYGTALKHTTGANSRQSVTVRSTDGEYSTARFTTYGRTTKKSSAIFRRLVTCEGGMTSDGAHAEETEREQTGRDTKTGGNSS